jgi:hypothetical protein
MIRLVLTWFALFIAVSVLTAVVNPSSLQAVCSAAGGMKLVDASNGTGEDETFSNGMDCPLCSAVAAPPVASSQPHAAPSPLAHALQFVASAHIASLTAPPLPSRGPPVHLT